MRKTKIVCTLGPATDGEETLAELISAGMNTARLNFSHGTHEEHRKRIEAVKKARLAANKPVALLLDTKGPEIRIKRFENGGAELSEGHEFTLFCGDSRENGQDGDRKNEQGGERGDILGNENGVAVTYDRLCEQVKEGDTILLDDGKIRLTVKEIAGRDVRCTVLNDGEISDNKGVNIPGAHLDMEYMSEADKADIIFGIQNDVDYIAASFVRNGADVRSLRRFLKENGGEAVKIISKIENEEGVDNFSEILEASDGIMVARGDMGVEIELQKLPGIQKNIIRRCLETGKPVITATQMMESMIENPTPTRAEISDVANAVYDGTSAVMLSGETAVGEYPVETVKVMESIISQAESDGSKYSPDIRNGERGAERLRSKEMISDAIGHAAYQAAEDLGAAAVIAVTISGMTAELMTKYKPSAPIIAATPERKTYYQSSLLRGIVPVLTKDTDKFDVMMSDAIAEAERMGLVKTGDMVVITAGMPLRKMGTTNLLRVETV